MPPNHAFDLFLVCPADTKSLHQRRRHQKRKWQNLIKTNKNAGWALSHVLVMWSCSESAHGSHMFCTLELYFNIQQLAQCLCIFSLFLFIQFIAFSIWKFDWLFAFKGFFFFNHFHYNTVFVNRVEVRLSECNVSDCYTDLLKIWCHKSGIYSCVAGFCYCFYSRIS